MSERFDFLRWASTTEAHDGWDTVVVVPTIEHFGNALHVWTVMQKRIVSVAEAARAFNCDPIRIMEAVVSHPRMDLVGDGGDFTRLFIEHEFR